MLRLTALLFYLLVHKIDNAWQGVLDLVRGGREASIGAVVRILNLGRPVIINFASVARWVKGAEKEHLVWIYAVFNQPFNMAVIHGEEHIRIRVRRTELRSYVLRAVVSILRQLLYRPVVSAISNVPTPEAAGVEFDPVG